jgi:hypothetical protein
MNNNDSMYERYATSSPFRGALRSAAVDIRTSVAYRQQMGLGPRMAVHSAKAVA